MAENDSYKVLVPELNVPYSIGVLRDIYGNEVGHSHVNETYFEGDVISADKVSPVVQELVERGDLEGRLEKVSEEPKLGLEHRLREAGKYADLNVDEVRALFNVLPSDAVQAIKEYEAEHGQNRPEIVEYDIGRGEAFLDRALGTIGSPRQDAEEGATAEFVTREVGESDFRFGRGPIGDGQPDADVPPTKDEVEDPDAGEVESASVEAGSASEASAPAAAKEEAKPASSGAKRSSRSQSSDEEKKDSDDES